MSKRRSFLKGIPVSVSLQSVLEAAHIHTEKLVEKKRLLYVSLLAVIIGALVSVIAKVLIYLINLITNISFYGQFSALPVSPQNNHLGLWVIIIPALGGIVVGLMALFGSKAIRGHGIPEAMEQILTNDSKIKPAITYLKPLSSAIAIGTGGPFGAEGPIIATGSALGSTLGQLLHISHYERKILLASGATAGMSAIFGTPVAAIFLAIELLLFEFSANSIIPVALACITGTAGHHIFFESGPVFPISHTLAFPSNAALFIYTIIGLLIGILSVGVTKIVYFFEDLFEKLPIHWMWWPTIGGLIVGIVGYIEPRSLGVGYNNITDVLSCSLTIRIVAFLCFFKFISWSIALGSGTSGGTLAPLMTIGGAAGMLIGFAVQHFFPAYTISLSMAALIGMSAMFAGASRALLTSIIFALEATGQINAFLPLLAGCTIAYLISMLLMENTIMTEKIARRGVKTPTTYSPDLLEQFTVKQAMKNEKIIISNENSIADVRNMLKQEQFAASHFIVTDNNGLYVGMINSSNLFDENQKVDDKVITLIKQNNEGVYPDTKLKDAVIEMATENVDILPVINHDKIVEGIISYKDIFDIYKMEKESINKNQQTISLKRRTLKLLVKGQRLINLHKDK